jgi:hypothetical protein
VPRKNKIPKDAVLLIPEPEQTGEQPAHGVKPGYYNSKQMLQLLELHKDDADAIHFIADNPKGIKSFSPALPRQRLRWVFGRKYLSTLKGLHQSHTYRSSNPTS